MFVFLSSRLIVCVTAKFVVLCIFLQCVCGGPDKGRSKSKFYPYKVGKGSTQRAYTTYWSRLFMGCLFALYLHQQQRVFFVFLPPSLLHGGTCYSGRERHAFVFYGGSLNECWSVTGQITPSKGFAWHSPLLTVRMFVKKANQCA